MQKKRERERGHVEYMYMGECAFVYACTHTMPIVENSIISVKYIGNCLLNYACMTEPFEFDGTAGACMNRAESAYVCVYGAF